MKRLFLTLSILLFFAAALPALAQGGVGGDYGLGDTAKAAGLKNETPVPVIIGNVIGTALSMIAVIFFILMVYGGFLWMTAHGNTDQVKKAQDTIIAAVIGIIIVLASYAITNFVFQSVGSGGGPGGGGGGGVPLDPGASCADETEADNCDLIDACRWVDNNNPPNFGQCVNS
ncbi:MAG: hypothetical protein COU35_04120 [Candidatus Magasanikbacteria bacterium CG10_big_fil_rev_8_21_14_0_10_47_10]|uniref:Uncharacterized protein n=1 Tax=Candidatus Magasanikbacteria bacterium CG10_big_fil_rev_8_21_14_0_10_47_10 TaxID=1974652 RepID=A0A2H0TPP1_9BACT|nr:MAG: hypothetical protein COU35_04120 [Candidatus Magasanikbacteria bacterium CG10_big_fil_rev_8_21_14_0_10_47_10]